MQTTTSSTPSTTFETEDRRWQAVLARDSGADGLFYYGVMSTGIFCRPTCPSRRPSRDRVAFFDEPGQAIRAGFRPCKRCRPGSQSSDAAFVQQVVDVIDSWLDGSPTLDDIAGAVGLSPSHVQRKFKQAAGISPAEYARQRRIQRFRSGLREGADVTTSLYDAGYESSASLYESVDRELGMTPSEYQSGGMNTRIQYAIAETPLGRLLLAYTERGVASIQIGDSDAALVEALQEEFPAAEVEPDGDSHPWFQVIVDYLEGEIPHPDLPVDVRGTAFQRRVWQAIRVIPPGETRSYREIAVEIGQPDAARAVANACANNRVALVIPCHRVVRADGKPGGYRWGERRKSALLAMEASRP